MKTLHQKLVSSDLRDCDKEAVEFPAFVQSFGMLIACDTDFRVTHVSENLLSILERKPDQVLGKLIEGFTDLRPIADAIKADSLQKLGKLHLKDKEYSFSRIESAAPYYAFELFPVPQVALDFSTAHRKFEAGSNLLQHKGSLDDLFNQIMSDVIVAFECDKVMIYKFDDNWNGTVIAERNIIDCPTYLGNRFPASDIPPQVRNLYYKNPVRYIQNVMDDESELFKLPYEVNLDLTATDIRGSSPFHIQYLRNMGVRGSLSMAILVNDKLWGLVSCHCYQAPFNTTHLGRLNLRRFSQIISTAIGQHLQMEQEQIQQLVQDVFSVYNIKSFMSQSKYRDSVALSIMTMTESDGLAMLNNGREYAIGKQPAIEPFEILSHLDMPQEPVYISSLMNSIEEKKLNHIAGLAILPIVTSTTLEDSIYLLLFRNEEVTEITWGGKHQKPKEVRSAIDLMPRTSFDQWIEKRRHHSIGWSDKVRYICSQLIFRLKDAVLYLFHQEQQQRTQMIEDSYAVGSWTLDVNENHLWWDSAMYMMYGIPEGSFGNNYEDWVQSLNAQDRTRVPLLFEQAIQNKEPFATTFTISHPEKGERVIKVQANYIYDDDGHVIRVIGTNFDITDELAREEELSKQRKLSKRVNKLANLGELAANIGHEINNPLAIIFNHLQMQQKELTSDTPDIDQLGNSVQQSKIATERIQRILTGLQSMVREEEHEQVPINVNQALEQQIAMLRPLFRIEQVKIFFEPYARDVFVEGDITQFQQIFINLLSNAKDAMEESDNKVIRLTITVDSKSVKISVKDNGCGIPADIRDKIFDSFYTTKPRDKGTGIGLSVVKSIVENMSGHIDVHSSEGEGSEFCVILPFLEAMNIDDSSDDETDDLVELVPEEGTRCLLVDDEPALAEILSLNLEQIGMDVTVVSGAREALAKLANESFHLLLTDANMPGMSGLDLLRTVSSSGDYAHMIKILMTGDITREIDVVNSPDKLIDGLIYKPYNIQDLMELLDSLEVTNHPH